MFLSAWDKAVSNYIGGLSLTVKTVSGGSVTEPTGDLGSSIQLFATVTADNYYNPKLRALRTSYDGYAGAIIGTGTTPPTKEDYKLSGDVISTFAYTSALTITPDDDGFTISTVYTITNTSDSPFTIGEIGLMAGTANSSGASKKYLLERTVLDEPLTIEAGGVGQLTYNIRVNYPTA